VAVGALVAPVAFENACVEGAEVAVALGAFVAAGAFQLVVDEGAAETVALCVLPHARPLCPASLELALVAAAVAQLQDAETVLQVVPELAAIAILALHPESLAVAQTLAEAALVAVAARI